MRKKISVFIIVNFLLMSYLPSFASANNEAYDHEELMQYEGYGKAMYETVLETTAFSTARYTENKDYMLGTMDAMGDYFTKFSGEFINDPYLFNGLGELKEPVAVGGAYLLTVGDWVKKLFTGYEKEVTPPPEVDYSFYENAMTVYETGGLHVKPNWTVYLFSNGKTSPATMTTNSGLIYSKFNTQSANTVYWYSYMLKSNTHHTTQSWKLTKEEVLAKQKEWESRASTVSGVVGLLMEHNDVVDIKAHYNGVEQKPTIINHGSPDLSRIVNYVNNNQQTIVAPEPRPILTNTAGERKPINISGSTFLLDGKPIPVNKDGTATIDGENYNLVWEKPIVKTIGDDVVIQKPDGKFVDVESGDRILDEGEVDDEYIIDDEIEDGCGIICIVGKLLSGLASIAKAIGGLVGKILDGLLGLFVPKDLSFISKEFESIKTTLLDKIGVIDTMGDLIKGSLESSGSNPLESLTIDLPAANGPLKVIEMSFIDEHVDTIKRIITAILVFTTAIYVYRKITGRGGVMEK